MTISGRYGQAIRGAALVVALCAAAPALAVESIDFALPEGDDALREAVQRASLLHSTAQGEEANDAQAIYSAARADYARIVGALYDAGYFGPTVSIRLDGREAAAIQPLQAPDRIARVRVIVDPGPKFTFGTARIGPLPPGVMPPAAYRPGAPASTGAIQSAAQDAVTAWRQAGHAKAGFDGERIRANHRAREIDADIAVAPGPRLNFGGLSFRGRTAVREARLREIAGYPEGEVFSPDALDEVGDRLRRTGVFSSVSVEEAETANPDGTLDTTTRLVDRAPRRFGFGVELSSSEGISTSGYWLHRNIFGGAERLRFDAEVSGIGEENGGMDYFLGTRLSRPATFHPDASAFVFADLERQNDPGYLTEGGRIGAGLSYIFNEDLTAEAALTLDYSRSWAGFGMQEFFHLSLPVDVTWDRRDKPLDATRGFYVDLNAKPYLGLNGSQSGVRLAFDGRAYQSFGDAITLAARAQVGSVFGSTIAGTRPDDLFFSGGGGTVRGHAFQSLGSAAGGGRIAGGRSFAAGSVELRTRFGNNFGAVAFYDIGYVGASSVVDGTGSTHSGAGLGLRYDTGIGPIRLDVATPVTGTVRGSRVQVYIGIGQSF